MSEHKLKELGLSELVAPEGKFRSVVIVDSAPYQIGTDSKSFMEAQQKCVDAYKPLSSYHVYNDRGEMLSLPALDYHITVGSALDAKGRIDSLQEAIDRERLVLDQERTAARNILKPHILHALTEFETKHGIKISVDDKGITPCKNGVALDVRLFRSTGGEFDEEFDNREELEGSVTKKLRVILETIFKTNNLPLSLDSITVPLGYWSK